MFTFLRNACTVLWLVAVFLYASWDPNYIEFYKYSPVGWGIAVALLLIGLLLVQGWTAHEPEVRPLPSSADQAPGIRARAAARTSFGCSACGNPVRPEQALTLLCPRCNDTLDAWADTQPTAYDALQHLLARHRRHA